MTNLFGCNPHAELVTAIPGTVQDEAVLHEKFKHLRYRGEWFYFKDDLYRMVIGLSTNVLALPQDELIALNGLNTPATLLE